MYIIIEYLTNGPVPWIRYKKMWFSFFCGTKQNFLLKLRLHYCGTYFRIICKQGHENSNSEIVKVLSHSGERSLEN